MVLLTGTPIKNKPYEISKLVNLLKYQEDPYQLPTTEQEFNQQFVYGDNHINNSNMPFFIRSIMGSLSYYDVTGDTTRFARKEFFEKRWKCLKNSFLYGKKMELEIEMVYACVIIVTLMLSCQMYCRISAT